MPLRRRDRPAMPSEQAMVWWLCLPVLIEHQLFRGSIFPFSPIEASGFGHSADSQTHGTGRPDLGISAAVVAVDAELSSQRAGAARAERCRHARIGGYPGPPAGRDPQG